MTTPAQTTACELPLQGLGAVPLAGYLASLGLLKAVASQADASATLRWDDERPVLSSAVGDVAQWLLDEYRPTPVLSPWNGGSGFGAKDGNQKRALEELLALDASRVGAFQESYPVAAAVAEESLSGRWSKQRVIRELRNRAPDALLEWLDAAVVLVGDDLAFPPLLGTGGNDGRLDFSTNFHQRLLDVLRPGNRSASLRWARSLTTGESERLVPAAVGQFDPFGAGGRNSSVFGAADSVVNPWLYVLMVEGATTVAAGVSRRLGVERGRAAMPFTVWGSPDGGGAGADSEDSRGEFWAPTWREPLTWPEVSQLFREARASWRGRTAARAVQMYEACRVMGVARGVDGFTRYGFRQRNGLAFVAVAVDDVRVRAMPEVRLAGPLEDWLDEMRRAQPPAAVALELRRADAAHVSFAKEGGGHRLLELLAAVTRLELAAGRSLRVRDAAGPRRRLPRGRDVLQVVLADSDAPETRLAAALAAWRAPAPAGRRVGMRHLLLPVSADPVARWASPAVPGLGIRGLVDVLADVLVWRAQHRADDEQTRGLVTTGTARLRAPWADAHAWVRGELDVARLEEALLAFLGLDWAAVQPTLNPGRYGVPDPGLALLAPLAAGMTPRRSEAGDSPVGLDPDWPLRLRAGRVGLVLAEAVVRLRRVGWEAHAPVTGRPGRDDHVAGRRLAAALLVPLHGTNAALDVTATRIDTEEPEESA